MNPAQTAHEQLTRIPNCIRSLRLASELNMRAASQKAGISYGAWQDIESGKREPRLSTVLVIAAAFEVRPGVLWGSEPISGD